MKTKYLAYGWILMAICTGCAFYAIGIGWRPLLALAIFAIGIVLLFDFIDKAKRAGRRRPISVFAGKTVAIVLYEGREVIGTLDCEPEDCGGYVLLRDAQVKEPLSSLPEGEYHDFISIPSSQVECFKTVNLDNVKN